MKIRVQYNDEEDKVLKMSKHADKVLVEEQHLFEGNFLVFTDIKPLEFQLQEFATKQEALLTAVADIYANLPIDKQSTDVLSAIQSKISKKSV